MKLLLCNAFVCDAQSPFNGKVCDIYIAENLIDSVQPSSGKAFLTPAKNVKVIDVKGSMVSPGWFDLRADFCDPGFEYKEDLRSGADTAIAGGFTDVALLPSSFPTRDTKMGIEYILNQSAKLPVNLHPYGCISQHREGKEMAELYDMHEAGAIGFTDGNRSVLHAGLLERSLLYAKIFNGLVLSSADETTISEGGKMHEGNMSTLLGLKGIPSLAEELMVGRDIELVRYTNGRIHFSHVSAKGAIELIRKARKQGLQITCDVAVANLCFTDEHLKEYDSNFKVYPPLRTKQDQKALWDGIGDGTIDAIVSNHHPQNIENKEVEFDYALSGMITLQTFLAMLVQHKPKTITYDVLLKAITSNPRKILGKDDISIDAGQLASLVIFNPYEEWTYNKNISRSKNSPLLQQVLTGKINAVICKEVYHKL
ncbi:MAG: dihydroorotase [Bacteroidia bacterium]|nr:dihydroorotase [Bacteroidia bacterium]